MPALDTGRLESIWDFRLGARTPPTIRVVSAGRLVVPQSHILRAWIKKDPIANGRKVLPGDLGPNLSHNPRNIRTDNTWQNRLNGMAAAAAQTCPNIQVTKGAGFNFYEDFILDQGEGEALPHILRTSGSPCS
jgi:hypothetical protein